jgi:pyruvate,water dikinase
MNYCQWFSRLEKSDASRWGAEATALKIVSDSGVSIAPGFVVSARYYETLFAQDNLKTILKRAFKGINPNRAELFAGALLETRSVILKTAIPKDVRVEVAAFFTELQHHLVRTPGTGIRVTVRGTALHLNRALSKIVKTSNDLEKLLKQLYLLTLQDAEVLQRVKSGGSVLAPSFSVLVQAYEEPMYSGIAYCHDPASYDDNTITIQASHSGNPSAKGLVIDDVYRVDLKSLTLLSRDVRKQWWAENDQGRYISPPHLGLSLQTLPDEVLHQLAQKIKTAQKQVDVTLLFEWVYAHKQFFITYASVYNRDASGQNQSEIEPLLKGLVGSLGIASGPVRLIAKKSDRKLIKEGDIVVVEQVSGKDYEWLQSAAGLICATGTTAGVEATIARMLAIPAVVGVSKALSHLHTGHIITLDASMGCIYSGVIRPAHLPKAPIASDTVITGTKVNAVVHNPLSTTRNSLSAVDGIGLLRGEFIVRLLNIHPQDVIRRSLSGEYSEILTEGLEQALQAVFPRPAMYQLHDLSSAELIGVTVNHHRHMEPNPLIGYRGAHRLLAEPEILEMEIQALTRLHRRGLTNFSIMIPMARTLNEVKQMIKYLRQSSLATEGEFDIWVKCETPALLILMDELCEQDIAGVCFEVSALSQLIVGIDKDNRQVGHHLDQTDDAVAQAIRYAITVCREAGVATSIMSEMDHLRPEVVQGAVEAGVGAVIVEAEMASEMRNLIAAIEQRIIVEYIIQEKEPAS